MHTMFTTLSLLLSTPFLASSAPTISPSSLNHPKPLKLDLVSTSANIAWFQRTHAKSAALVKRNIGGVRLSDEANFGGHVWYGIYPLGQCIGLGDYTSDVLSFRPDEGTECLLMQGQCDADEPYADLTYNATHFADLSYYDFYKSLSSYMCFNEA